MQDESAPPRGSPDAAWLCGAMVATCIASVLFVAFVVAQRLGYRYELEWLEGAVLQHVDEVRAGRVPYAEPSARFSPFYYTPLYYYAAAPALAFFGHGFLGPRLVSLAASIGSLVLVFGFVVRETGRRSAALAALALFTAGYWWSGRWFEVARIDSLFLCLTLAGAYALRFARGRGRAALAGVLLAAAVLTKQTALFVALPLFGWAWLARRDAIALATFTAALVSAAVLLDLGSDGWARYCLIELGRGHPFERGRLVSFWTRDVFSRLPFAIALCAAALGSARRESDAFYWVLGAGALATACLPRIKLGGYENNLLPVFAVVAIAAGLALGRLTGSARGTRLGPLPFAPERLAYGLVIAQLLWSLPRQSPLAWVPTAEDRAAGDAVVRTLAEAKGAVLVPTAPYLAERAGKHGSAHQMNLTDLVWSSSPHEARVLDAFRQGLASGHYERVVLNNARRAWLVPLPPAYEYRGRIFAEGLFEPTSGSREFVPAHLYVRRE